MGRVSRYPNCKVWRIRRNALKYPQNGMYGGLSIAGARYDSDRVVSLPPSCGLDSLKNNMRQSNSTQQPWAAAVSEN